MDPKANLAEQARIANEIIKLNDAAESVGIESMYNDELASLAGELAELVQALAHWRAKGGFEPEKPPGSLAFRMIALLHDMGVGFKSTTKEATTQITLEVGDKGVEGYSGFAADMIFAADGSCSIELGE